MILMYTMKKRHAAQILNRILNPFSIDVNGVLFAIFQLNIGYSRQLSKYEQSHRHVLSVYKAVAVLLFKVHSGHKPVGHK